MKFSTIVADVPWDYETWSPNVRHKSPDNHYAVMSFERLCALPVGDAADKHCTLLFWSTWPMLKKSLEMIHAWGFVYKSGYPWLKLTRNRLVSVGTGYHARGATEPLLIASKGHPSAPEPFEREAGVLFDTDEPSGLLASRRGPHSAKPDDFYRRAEVYDGPWLELFARRQRDRWTCIGNELDGLDICESLGRVIAGKPLPEARRDQQLLPPNVGVFTQLPKANGQTTLTGMDEEEGTE